MLGTGIDGCSDQLVANAAFGILLQVIDHTTDEVLGTLGLVETVKALLLAQAAARKALGCKGQRGSGLGFHAHLTLGVGNGQSFRWVGRLARSTGRGSHQLTQTCLSLFGGDQLAVGHQKDLVDPG